MKFLKSRKDNPSYVVRMLSPFGIYPSSTIQTGDSLLYISKDICFSIVPFSKDDVENELYYSEVEWLTFNEIKLYSSVIISSEAYMLFYPFRYPEYLDIKSYDGILENVETIRKLLIETIIHPGKWIDEYNFQATNIYQNWKENGLPFICGGPEYEFRVDGSRDELQRKIYQKFDTTDHLLIRGVSTLLRSRMINVHMHLMEESINMTFISLEASFRLVLRQLERNGIKNPSSSDAAKYIARVFNSKPTNKYFEDYYSSRIMSFHPESRFGIFPHAPLMADDHYDLFDNLKELYLFLITGFVDPKYNEKYEYKII